MRTIKFRGKSIQNGEWLYGNIQIPKPPFDEYYMLDNDGFQLKVDPATVGQFTGLEDKKGKEIFEGDVVTGIFEIRTGTRVVTHRRQKSSCSITEKMEVTGYVIFSIINSAFWFETEFKQEYKTNFWAGCGYTRAEKKANEWRSTYSTPRDYLFKVTKQIEVIGTIHDTKPETK